MNIIVRLNCSKVCVSHRDKSRSPRVDVFRGAQPVAKITGEASFEIADIVSHYYLVVKAAKRLAKASGKSDDPVIVRLSQELKEVLGKPPKEEKQL